MKPTYEVRAWQDDDWWLARVVAASDNADTTPLNSLTQARSLTKVEPMARDLIATILDVEEDVFSIEVQYVLPGAVSKVLCEAKGARAWLDAAQELWQDRSAIAARVLSNNGYSLREVAKLLGLSHQRVDQLLQRRDDTERSGIWAIQVKYHLHEGANSWSTLTESLRDVDVVLAVRPAEQCNQLNPSDEMYSQVRERLVRWLAAGALQGTRCSHTSEHSGCEHKTVLQETYMGIKHRDPTDATIKELYANAYRCAAPSCKRPLYRIDDDTGVRTLNSRISHIAAQSERGPRWDKDMSEDENRSVRNLLLLCLEHASEVDESSRIKDFPSPRLLQWKANQLAEFDALGQGWILSDDDAAQVLQASSVISIVNSNVQLGGEAGQAPGAGGGGGGAIGTQARAGDGGAGGEIVFGIFRADELPDSVDVTVGAGGLGGTDGAEGKPGEDTSFGDLLVAKSGKSGKGGRSGDEPTSDKDAVGARCTGLFLANYVEAQNGLINALSAGWTWYGLPEFPGLVRGSLVFFMEPNQGQLGSAHCVAELLDEQLQSVECGELQFVFEEADVVRAVGIFHFAAIAHRPGIWTARVVDGAEEIVSIRFGVVQQ